MAGTTVVLILTVFTRVMKYEYLDSIPELHLEVLQKYCMFNDRMCVGDVSAVYNLTTDNHG